MGLTVSSATRQALLGILACTGFWVGASLSAQEVRIVEEDGIQFRETRDVERRPVAEVQLREQTETIQSPEFVTEVRSNIRMAQVPVVEYRSEAKVHYPLGIFGRRQVIQQVVPHTRWETRRVNERTPVSYTAFVPETRVVQVPVRVLGFVQEERVSRVALGPSPGTWVASGRPSAIEPPVGPPPVAGPAPPPLPTSESGAPAIVVRRFQSSRLDSDPPRYAVPPAN